MQPFGALLLGSDGIIAKYSRAQGFIVGRAAVDMIGRDFFRDVAHCCLKTPVYFSFKRFQTMGLLDVVLDHDFVLHDRKVRVQNPSQAPARQPRHCWMFIKVIHANLRITELGSDGNLAKKVA